MANIRKQFNFRNGVQVDDDNLVVSPTGLVGIGTTIPTELLDVRGDAKVVGLVTANQVFTPDLTASSANITNLTLGTSIIGGGVSISSGIITASGAGVVTYYGDGGRLSNLPTSQWLDVDVGLGFTSIYALGFVGVGTADPRFVFQVSGNTDTSLAGFSGGVGITSEGNILATGIATAAKFVGIGSGLTELNASNIAYGTISNDRIPVLLNSKLPSDISISGIITASSGVFQNVTSNVTGDLTGNVVGILTGNLTGTASTALSLSGTPNIVVGLVTSSDIISGDISAQDITAVSIAVTTINTSNINATGIITSSEFNVGTGGTIVNITSDGRVAIGSDTPTRPFEIITTGTSEIELVGTESRIILAEEKSGISISSNAAEVRYGNSNNAFELVNYAPGDFNFYLHSGVAGVDTGGFNWIYGQDFSEKMSLTYDGSLGLGITNPSNTLHVVGTSTVTGNSFVGGDLTVYGNINGSVTIAGIVTNNINASSGVSTFFGLDVDNGAEINGNITVSAGSSIGIGTDAPVTDVDAFNKILVVGAIGVGQSIANINNKLPDIGSIFVDGQVISDNVGIGTTYAEQRLSVYGNVELYPEVDGPPTSVSYVSGTKVEIAFDNESRIGIGTTVSQASVDFRLAGKGISGGAASFMMPPQVSTTVGLNTAGKEGALVFNTTTKKFQGYTGSAWVDLH